MSSPRRFQRQNYNTIARGSGEKNNQIPPIEPDKKIKRKADDSQEQGMDNEETLN